MIRWSHRSYGRFLNPLDTTHRFSPALTSTNVHRSFLDLQNQLKAGTWELQVKHELLSALTPEIALEPAALPRMFPDISLDETRTASYAHAEVVLRSRNYSKLIRQAI